MTKNTTNKDFGESEKMYVEEMEEAYMKGEQIIENFIKDLEGKKKEN